MNILTTNTKLSRDGIYTFNHPSGRPYCIGADSCLGFCFWDNIYKQYPNTKPAHIRNWELSQKPFFADMVIYELQSNPRMKLIRPYASGEYTKKGVEDWHKIASAMPDRRFYSYTKAYKVFDFSALEKLKNFKIIQSEGGIHPVDKRKPHAIIVDKGQPIPDGYVDASESDAIGADPRNKKIALYRKGGK